MAEKQEKFKSVRLTKGGQKVTAHTPEVVKQLLSQGFKRVGGAPSNKGAGGAPENKGE